MVTSDDAVRLTVESADGSIDTFDVPGALIDRLAEDDEPSARIVADVAVMAFAGRAHAIVHHAPGEPDPALAAAEEAMLDAFEARFGVSYAEATGHAH